MIAVALKSMIGGCLFFLEEFLHYSEQTKSMVTMVLFVIGTASWLNSIWFESDICCNKLNALSRFLLP